MEVSGRAGVVVQASVVLLVGLASGCGGPVGVKAPPGASSSEDGGGTTSGTTSGAATSSGGETEPGRVPPEPFELPEGCGDGVIVPGQYDCFFPVSIDWIEDAIGGHLQLHPLDLEGDGRDEMIALRGGKNIAVLRWKDGELELGPLIESHLATGSATKMQTLWDWNGDGRHDVTTFSWGHPAKVIVHMNLGAQGLGEQMLVHELPPFAREPGLHGNTGFVVPLNVGGHRGPELLLSMQVDGLGGGNPAEDLVLFQRAGSEWVPVGEQYRWGPCGWLEAVAHADFNGDGHEDVALLDHGQACDPYPSSYDPEWYRVYVLLSNAAEGVLELGGWYPTGGVVKEPILWTEDVTGDGYLDLIVEIDDPLEHGVAVMRGRGDGTFDAGSPVDLSPILPSYNARALIDVDGDGTREWIVTVVEGRPWVIPFDFSKDGIAPMVALNDPEAGGHTRFKELVGDINGDGVDDYRVRAAYGTYSGEFLMISAP